MKLSNPVVIQFYLDKRKKGQWRWRLKRSGRILADSGESYINRLDGESAVKSTLKAILNGNIRLDGEKQ